MADTYQSVDLWKQARVRMGLNFPDGLLDFETNPRGVIAVIDDGLSDFASMHKWDWLFDEATFDLVVGTKNYVVPSFYTATLFVGIDNNILTDIQRKKSVHYFGKTGTPRAYSVLNNVLTLYPTPSEVRSVVHGYYKNYASIGLNVGFEPATLEEIDLPYEIPSQFWSLAELCVARQMCVLINDRERWQFINEQIADEKRSLQDDIMKATTPMVPQVRTDTGF